MLTLRALREQHRFVRGLVSWVGFRQTAVPYERPARFAGETKWPLRKMLHFAVDGITSFSTVPLRMATWLGCWPGWSRWAASAGRCTRSSSAASFAAGRRIMILVGLGSSAQLLMTGILGEYVGRIYEEVKRRPLYVVDGEINLASREPAARRACAGDRRVRHAGPIRPDVVQADDAARIGHRFLEREAGLHAFRKQALSAADRQRIEQQVQLVDEIGLQQQVHQLAAAVGQDHLAGLGLERRIAPTTSSSRMMVVLRQVGFSSVLDTTYFAGAFMMSPNGSPGAIGSNAAACLT